MPYCSECGTEVSAQAKFCRSCGSATPLQDLAVPEAPTRVSAPSEPPARDPVRAPESWPQPAEEPLPPPTGTAWTPPTGPPIVAAPPERPRVGGGWGAVVFLFGLVGGAIGWLSLQAGDRPRANHVLKWGLIWSAIYTGLSVAAYALIFVLLAVSFSSVSNNAGSLTLGGDDLVPTIVPQEQEPPPLAGTEPPATVTSPPVTVTEPPSRSAPAASSGSMTHYHGSDFSIAYPASWSLDTREQFTNGTYYDTSVRGPGSLLLRVDMTPGAPPDLYEASSAVVNALRRQSGYRELAYHPSTIAGYPALRWEFEVPEHGITVRKTDVFFTDRNGNGFAVLTQAPAGDWSDWAGTFAGMRSSLVDLAG